MVDYLLFLIYKTFKFFVWLLPKFIIKLFLDATVAFLYFVNKEHKQYAKANLDMVYKDKISEHRKWEIIKSSYRNLVYNLYEFIESQTLTLEKIEKKVKIQNEHYILDALKNKRKIILITAHYGNWEYGNSFISLKYAPTTVVGRLMNNKFLNKELDETRSRNNTQMLTKREASRGLVKAIKEGRIVGLVIDQHNGSGIDVEFLGYRVKQTDSTSRLSVKFNAIILPLFFTMDEFGKYTGKFYEPIEPKDFEGETQIQDLTQKQADIMGEHILNKPDQWFWQHKRFKEYHKEIYE